MGSGAPGERVLRAAAKLWYLRRLVELQEVPSPDPGSARGEATADPVADRVLLVGNGFAHGWGTRSHGLALAGQLQAALTRRSQRPTAVEYAGAEIMNLAAVGPWLRDRRLDDHDLVLLVLSLNDALRLTPVAAYRSDMTRLLAGITGRLRPGASIVVAGIHDLKGLPHYGGLLGRIVQRRADRLNDAVRSVVHDLEAVHFMELPAPVPEPGRPNGSPAMYAAWSRQFVGTCAPLLEDGLATRGPRGRRPPAEHEWAWEPGRAAVSDEGGLLRDELDGLAQDAKEEFGVDLAYVTLIDGGRQYYLANTAKGGAEVVPLELSHCRETVRGDDPLVVTNSFRDPRFRDSPLIDVPQFRFYAGVPLKNAEGVNVGTFCVSSVLPHRKDFVPSDPLLAYAARAQAALQEAVGSGDAAVLSTAERT